jgi:hypothetical protein
MTELEWKYYYIKNKNKDAFLILSGELLSQTRNYILPNISESANESSVFCIYYGNKIGWIRGTVDDLMIFNDE